MQCPSTSLIEKCECDIDHEVIEEQLEKIDDCVDTITDAVDVI